jgi:hypothetical protein
VSPSDAVECYPCREVSLNYSDSRLFHGGDTGSTPVRDAKLFNHFTKDQYWLCSPPDTETAEILSFTGKRAFPNFVKDEVEIESNLIARAAER